MITLFTLLGRYHKAVFRIASIVALILLSAYIVHASKTPPRVIQLDPITKVIEVPVETITTNTVTKYVRVEDRAAAKQLLAENDTLKATVDQLALSLAEATSTGQGETHVTIPSTTTGEPPQTLDAPVTVTFKDWRLDFRSVGAEGTYTLSQKFSIVNTVGRTEKNDPVNLVRLFEIGKDGERIPIPTIETTTISVMPDQMHFYVHPTLQAGVAIVPSWITKQTPTTTGGTTEYPVSVVLAVPWWKRGTMHAVEATRYAYVTPVLTMNGTEVMLGILPISANLGTLKHSPFTDLWVSPFLGISSKNSAKRFGIVFTTTF